MADDREVKILTAIHSMDAGMTRRTMMKLAGAAGVSLALTPAVSRIAAAAEIVRGNAACLGISPAIDFWSIYERAYNQVTKDLGLTGKIYFHEGDTGRGLSQARSLTTSDTKMLSGMISPDGALPALAKICQNAGIYYTAVWDSPSWFTPPDIGDYYVSFLTPNSAKEAYEVAKILIQSIGGEGKIAHIGGLAVATDNYRLNGLKKAVSEHPGVELITGWRADWDRTKARNATISILAAHPDVKGIFASADDMAFGVLTVLRERKKDVKVAAIVGLPEGLTEIAKGEHFVATASDIPPYMAGFSAVSSFDALNGWKPTLGERMLHYGSIIVTPENAAAVNEKIYSETAQPYDWVKMSRTLNPENWDPQNTITAIDPNELWADYPEGREKLNPVYKDAKQDGEFSKVDALYADHFKAGPLKS